MDFVIRSIGDEKDLKRLRDFLLGQALSYPRYDSWVEGVCIPELENGHKTGIIAYSDKKVVGDVIYQQHKQLPRTREIKNLRINPEYRRMDLGHFLLRQAEEEGKKSFERIILDTDSRNGGIIKFLLYCGYHTIMQRPLYCSHNLGIVMEKEFNSNNHNIL